MGKNHRNSKKRILYNQYAMRSKILGKQLKEGVISQEEFDRQHEALDDKYYYVR
jgi:hypothetical protein